MPVSLPSSLHAFLGKAPFYSLSVFSLSMHRPKSLKAPEYFHGTFSIPSAYLHKVSQHGNHGKPPVLGLLDTLQGTQHAAKQHLFKLTFKSAWATPRVERGLNTLQIDMHTPMALAPGPQSHQHLQRS